MSAPLQRLTEKETTAQIMQALDTLATAAGPRILMWDPIKYRLRLLMPNTRAADTHLINPLCLGTFDYRATSTDIREVLDLVLRQPGLLRAA